jgi:hypothetical protein|tara:strand:+ start:33 stop:854 length:822 start_codon:yes stop_codon:yes gene_type:complete
MSKDAEKLADVEFTAERVNDTYFNPLSYLGFINLRNRHKGDLSKFYSAVTASAVPKGSFLPPDQIMGDHPEKSIYGTDVRGTYDPKEGRVRVNTSDFRDLTHSGKLDLTDEEASRLQKMTINEVESHEFGHAGFEHLKKQGKLPKGNFSEEDVMQVLDSMQFYKRLGTVRPVAPARKKLNFVSDSPVSWPVARIAMGVISRQKDIPYPYSRNLSRKEKRWVDYIIKLTEVSEKELDKQSRFSTEPTKKKKPQKLNKGGFIKPYSNKIRRAKYK